MPTQYDVEQIPIESAQPGDYLIVERNGRRKFRVENKKVESLPPAPTKFILLSEPVDGTPWTIEGPAGTPVIRIVREYQVP
ncbi:MAG: hypothetical protein JWR32_3285 [Mycobacterium sp.]|jgi:hypothetical protein|nr:hypothetical protein [Mycobacterium sp.]